MLKKIGGVVVSAIPLVIVSAGAYAVDDYSVIAAAVSVAGVSAAIIGMGALRAAPNVASWASRKLSNFFR